MCLPGLMTHVRLVNLIENLMDSDDDRASCGDVCALSADGSDFGVGSDEAQKKKKTWLGGLRVQNLCDPRMTEER